VRGRGLTKYFGDVVALDGVDLDVVRRQHRSPRPSMQSIAARWATWLKSQHLTGNGAIPDYANPLQMNRYTWYQAHDWKVPYPGDPKICTPSQVPGGTLPSPDAY
jgi:hypothetical protein